MSLDFDSVLIVDDQSTNNIDYHFIDKSFFSNFPNTDIQPSEYLEAKEKKPFLVIINNKSKKHNAKQICYEIKENEGTSEIEILIIDDTIDDESRQEFYDLNVLDVIPSNFNKPQFIHMLKRVSHDHNQIEELTLKSKKAKHAAKAAIYDIGDQASVIHFLQNSFKCLSIDQLTDLIVETAAEFGLYNTVQLTTPVQIYNRSSAGDPTERDIEMMKSFRELGHVYQLGRRLILNFGPITQLIKNLPDKDEEKCGRLRDNLALILEGALNRLSAIFFLEEMKCLFEEINSSVKKTKIQQSENKKKNLKIMEEMYEEIQLGLSEYGLTEDQEIALMSTVDRYSEKIFCTYEEGIKADSQLETIAAKINLSLAHFADNQS